MALSLARGSIVAALCIGMIVPIIVATYSSAFSYANTASAPSRPVAIVFGAGVTGDGRLTRILQARVDEAVALYRAGKVNAILMSGDDAHDYHNEPSAMRRYAISRGVPASAITRDFAGFRTYDSCYRARHVFGIRSALLVTQSYHLPRAIFLARSVGIDAAGVAAPDTQSPLHLVKLDVRENLCLLLAMRDVIIHRQPKFLGQPVALAMTTGQTRI